MSGHVICPRCGRRVVCLVVDEPMRKVLLNVHQEQDSRELCLDSLKEVTATEVSP